ALLASAGGAAPPTSTLEPVVVFVHGRGQGDRKIEEVRSTFENAFAATERRVFGQEIVPRSSVGFVWYADVIDPSVEKMPDVPECQFLGEEISPNLASSTLKGLLELASKYRVDSFGMELLTGDPYKDLKRVAVRCEADARLELELEKRGFAGRPIVLVA